MLVGTERTKTAAEAAELEDTQVSFEASKSSKKQDKTQKWTRHLTCIFSIISNKAEVWREESEMKCLSWFVDAQVNLFSAAVRGIIRVQPARCGKPWHT